MAAVQRVIDLAGSGRITDHDEFVAVLSAELFDLRSVGTDAHCQDYCIGRQALLFSGRDFRDADLSFFDRCQLVSLRDRAAVKISMIYQL